MTLKELLIFCLLASPFIFWRVIGGRPYHKSEETIRNETATEFAKRLKEKAQKPEYPWEEWLVSEDDIDEVLKEMRGDKE